MRQRTFDCQDCGTSVTVPLTPGRPRIYCADCVARRKAERGKRERAAVRAAFTTCQRPGCGNPIPEGSRADRKWCSPACQSWVNKRLRGEVAENTRTCSSCLQPLAGRQANATVCPSRKCLSWASRHPGVPHPSTQPRVCKQCGASIDHLNGKAKFCPGECRNRWYAANDREGYNAKARAFQSSPKGKATRRAYLQANADKRQAWARQNRQKNPERYAQYWKQWAEANREAVAEVGRMRRARQKGNPDSIGVSVWEWRKILNRSRGHCYYCGVKADVIHMDHVVPLAKGGRHAPANVVVACSHCNLTKHAMFLSVWKYRRLRLRPGA